MAFSNRNAFFSSARQSGRNDSAISDVDISSFGSLELSQLQVDSSSSDSDAYTPRRSRARSHGRSMSNPFPSFFSGETNKLRDHLSPGPGGSEPNGEDRHMHNMRGNRQAANQPQTTAAPQGHGGHLSTGPCITCGALMRWVVGVPAFRCSICLTVNDLLPEVSATAGRERAQHQGSSASVASAHVDSISIERTKALVNRCLRNYLLALLANATRSPTSQPDQTPGEALLPSHTWPVHPQQVIAEASPVQAPEGSQSNLQRGSLNEILDRKPIKQSACHIRNASDVGASRAFASGEYLLSPKVTSIPLATSAMANKRDEIETKRIFRPLEEYIMSHFSIDCFNYPFIPRSPALNVRHLSPAVTSQDISIPPDGSSTFATNRRGSAMGHEVQLVTDVAKNNMSSARGQAMRTSYSTYFHQPFERAIRENTTDRLIDINWPAVDEWYRDVLNVGETWMDVYNDLVLKGTCQSQPKFVLKQIEANILQAQEHTQRIVLKALEAVLKRPGRRIHEPNSFRFLVIALANPLLHSPSKLFSGKLQGDKYSQASHMQQSPNGRRGLGPASGRHSVIIKRIIGLISNSSDEWHSHLVACFSRLKVARFVQIKDLVSGFLAYRLVRYNEKEEKTRFEYANGLLPKTPADGSASPLHAAFGQASGSTKKPGQKIHKKISHGDDWQIKAAVRALGLLFSANNYSRFHTSSRTLNSKTNKDESDFRGRSKSWILSTSDFYMTLLDNCDLVADFEAWEQKKAKFTFCQYPFLLSIWAKIQILEHEARRQMKNKARDAFFDSIMTRRDFDQHFVLNVRRDCLVEDSLKAVSEAIGSGSEDIKKGLRIIFNGEEGIDAGGLRKEWFLLLVRELFNPDNGMFTYDEESQYCYFNPNSFEPSDQFFLVGVVLGLAIYNSTILDFALPPFAFRKLLLAAPVVASGLVTSMPWPPISYSLNDLAEYRPRLAKSLQQLLDYNGNVEATFSLDFTVTVNNYGSIELVDLCPDGNKRPVDNSNRREYVDLYIRYLLDTAVSRQFEPFKRGFFTVCGCNALGLFHPDEIELLVRGSDEPLDVASLRLAASYDNWNSHGKPESEPTIEWFWNIFENAAPQDQRKLLIFITGSDRIPATGPASLSIRIICLGNDCGRYPTARTCFNTLTLYRYSSMEKLEEKIWGAVKESEGFGLK